MRMTAREFLDWPHKAVTLLGMSGVGKTTLANRLPKTNWFHYSGDYRIGTRYLDEPILDNIKRQAMQVGFLRDLLRSDSIYIKSNITVDNLQPVSTFLGKIGDSARGGLAVNEFRRRQHLHHDAEVGAMKDVPRFIEKSREIYGYDHFVNDAGGSVCEIEDPSVVPTLAEHTLVLYLRADAEMEGELRARQRDDPKPLYYPETFFDTRLAAYLEERGLATAAEVEPDDFVQWVFPPSWPTGGRSTRRSRGGTGTRWRRGRPRACATRRTSSISWRRSSTTTPMRRPGCGASEPSRSRRAHGPVRRDRNRPPPTSDRHRPGSTARPAPARTSPRNRCLSSPIPTFRPSAGSGTRATRSSTRSARSARTFASFTSGSST